MQVLLVEDDDRVGSAIVDVLNQHGFVVRRAATAREALERLDPLPDVVVLDLGLPDRDGFALCAQIRQRHTVPIIMSTARGDLSSRVHGLHLGADDYLVKPFDVRELMARIHAVTRRARSSDPTTGSGSEVTAPSAADENGAITVGDLVVDPRTRTAGIAGRPLQLTRKEFEILALLAARPGLVFGREQILSAVWQSRWDAGGRHTLEVHVASLRAKAGRRELIETVRGVGYRLAANAGLPAGT
jgi:DNA-binding response OmpR family regulator